MIYIVIELEVHTFTIFIHHVSLLLPPPPSNALKSMLSSPPSFTTWQFIFHRSHWLLKKYLKRIQKLEIFS